MIRIEEANSKNWYELTRLFATSNECTECWCMKHRTRQEACPTGVAARQALRKAVASGTATGVLAFADGKVAGWCAVDPVNVLIGHEYNRIKGVAKDPYQWMIHCVYVPRSFRTLGVSRALIRGAVELARRHGASEVLAMPTPAEARAKFEDCGFTFRETLRDFYQVLALSIESPAQRGYQPTSWSNL